MENLLGTTVPSLHDNDVHCRRIRGRRSSVGTMFCKVCVMVTGWAIINLNHKACNYSKFETQRYTSRTKRWGKLGIIKRHANMPGSHKGTSERSLVYGSITQNLLAFAFFPPLTTCNFLDPTNSNKELFEAPLPDIYIFLGPFSLSIIQSQSVASLASWRIAS